MQPQTGHHTPAPSESTAASAIACVQVLGGFLAGVSLSAASAAQALSEVDLFDDRQAIDKGFNLIYEARDDTLTEAERNGRTQVGPANLHTDYTPLPLFRRLACTSNLATVSGVILLLG